jgi:hypothetical protein
MSAAAQALLSLFEGSAEAHGTYTANGAVPLGTKVEIKSSARTLREPASEEIWDNHLAGKTPLGVIPLRADDMIVWACGDIDKYDINHGEIVRKIAQYKLPLILTKSKSGGAHIFLFLSSPADPAHIQTWMRVQMALLGYGTCEIFPKQTKILRDRGDLGNWIVMPYFGQTQEAIRANGGALTVDEFIREAQRLRQNPDDLVVKQPKSNGDADNTDIVDGPPCLQHLIVAGFPEGTRNKGLFALGVYCRKKWPDQWQRRLEEYNQNSMRPPLPADEVMAVVRSLEKRDYQYSCNDIPLVNHCNAPLCRMRTYGVGGDGGDIPVISGLSVIDADPPIWFLDIGDQRMELSTDELLNYRLFQKRCTEKLFQIWRTLKQDTWMRMVGKAMESVSHIEVSQEISPQGHFHELIEEFCTNRTRGTRPEDLFTKRVYHAEPEDRYYFRIGDLQKHVEKAGMKMDRPTLIARVRELGGGKKFLNIKGRGVNTWWVEQGSVEFTPPIDPPELQQEVM